MSEAVDPAEAPEKILDGVRIAETETGDQFTVTVSDDRALTVASLDGEVVKEPTAGELDRWIRHGEYYIPEYSPAHEVHDAIEALAGGRNE